MFMRCRYLSISSSDPNRITDDEFVGILFQFIMSSMNNLMEQKIGYKFDRI